MGKRLRGDTARTADLNLLKKYLNRMASFSERKLCGGSGGGSKVSTAQEQAGHQSTGGERLLLHHFLRFVVGFDVGYFSLHLLNCLYLYQ